MCKEGIFLRRKHYFEMLDGRILPFCAFCYIENPKFKIIEKCLNHYSIFNILKIKCSKECSLKGITMNWNIFKSQVEKDAEIVLKDLESVMKQVQSGALNQDFLNVITLLQPLLAIVEKDFPQYAVVIQWVNTLLQDGLKANQVK